MLNCFVRFEMFIKNSKSQNMLKFSSKLLRYTKVCCSYFFKDKMHNSIETYEIFHMGVWCVLKFSEKF